MDLNGATSCGRCAGTRGCWRGKGPQSHWAMIHRPASHFCWTAVLLLAFPRWGGWGGTVHTLSRLCSMLFSLLTQGQVTVSMLAEQEVRFSDPVDGADVIACVSRLMVGSLVFLGSRPILWLSSTLATGRGDRRAGEPRGDLS